MTLDEIAYHAALTEVRARDIATLDLALSVGIAAYLDARNRRAPSPEAQGNVAVEPVADLLDDLEDLTGLAREYDYHKANPLQERIASSIASLSERLAAVITRLWPNGFGPQNLEDELRAKLAEARAAAFEEAAQIAENLSNSEHIAFDIREGNFPEQSDVRTAIAAAIRARAFRDATSEGDAG